MRSPSDTGHRLVVVGNPAGPRVERLRAALARRGDPSPRVVAYGDLLDGRASLAEALGPGSVLRIESPDRDFGVERGLIALGAEEPDDGPAPRIGAAAALGLEADRGRILYPRQWFLGFRALLRRIDRERREAGPHRVMNPPGDIAAMFDKPACRDRFEAAGVPCPRGLGRPAGYDDLRDRMDRHRMPRVFVKLAHGSSASGVVALETGPGGRVQARTTVEVVRAVGETRLYNTRAIPQLHDGLEVAALVDALCREGAYAEQWVPKAGAEGGPFDLRVVVVAGRPRHVVMRVGRSPMTNLHLKNRRGDLDALRARVPEDAWASAMDACRRAAGLWPSSLYAGVDLALSPDLRLPAVLEINAFGDLLPGVEHDGLDTYGAELAALGGEEAE